MTWRALSAILFIVANTAWADSVVDDACRRPSHLADPEPIIAVHGPAHRGTDRSIEPFALLLMQAAASWRGQRDDVAATRAVDELLRWSRSGALREIVDVGDARTNTNSIYSLRRALTAILGAWTDLRSTPAGRAHDEEIERWLAGLVTMQNVATGAAKSRGKGEAESNHNNHALLRATVEAQWAALVGRPELAESASALAHATIGEMRPDGSLPRETARGVRALWYQRHALASLAYIAELLQPSGYDLWNRESDGKDLHRAVEFLLLGIERPENLAPYVGASDARRQDLGFLKPRGNGRHYMAWAELYRARFSKRREARQLEHLLPRRGDPGWPLIDDYVGGNATCRILTTAVDEKI